MVELVRVDINRTGTLHMSMFPDYPPPQPPSIAPNLASSIRFGRAALRDKVHFGLGRLRTARVIEAGT